MTTMTETQNNIKEQLADYQGRNKASKPRPTPGTYYLQMPLVIEVKEVDFGPGQQGVEFNLGGTTIVSDANGDPTFRGEELNKYYKIHTVPRKGERWSDGLDFLRHFGVDLTEFAENPTVENAKALAAQIAGQQTPNPVFLTYKGDFKNPVGSAKKKTYLKAKDFLKADGTYARVAYRVDGVVMAEPPIPDEVIAKGKQAEREYLDQFPVVFANLEPGYRGWVTD